MIGNEVGDRRRRQGVADANPVEVGQIKFVLARGLWDSPHGDRKRARNLVAEALELSQNANEKAMYQKWLAEHPL